MTYKNGTHRKRVHNRTRQPPVEYEQSDVSTAN
ncbi:hypothetical protein T03_11901 [Trichinella britovi]|uniref:Uncharacterized protein n=1 Tax=Trichinella britovi TaxID=45882 RepID=A0A0V1BNV4_TRIBR|nr:hypothetical protein T03_7212 [Trichinella britovi]KRY43677.1 hypothetical protein T03_11901 [Trichinella britovi]